ncbi:MAG: hypothetical protein FWD35_03270, partial [Oscillospiraceae bacterium]|nr:hypothetical protein [Oscillospiraceae bacterium]
MTSPFKADIVLDGELSPEKAREKWKQTALDVGKRINRGKKVKGSPMYIHSHDSKTRRYILYYYHNYGGDFCDTMFTGEIFEYDDGKCQISGRVTASRFMKRFAVVLAALSLPLALVLTVVISYISLYLEVTPL